jgi:RNA polymerase sigma-70 factor (ECF subfamily)
MGELYDDEQILLGKVAEGDRKAFNRLYAVHIENVYNYIYLFTKSKEETEEILQEVFVNIWKHREKLAAVNSFKHYVFRAAKNRLINHLRHTRIKNRVFSEIREHAVIMQASADDEIIYRESYRLIQEAVEKLPPKRKAIFKMHIEEEISYAEIAEQLKISISVVKKQFYKACHSVRQYLRTKGEILPLLLVYLLTLLQTDLFF